MTIWKTALTVVLGATLVGCAASVADHPGAEEEEHEEPVVAVHVAPAELRTLDEHVNALGQSEALLDRRAMLGPLLEGQVSAILAAPGARVQKGQAIVELDPRLPAADLAERRAMATAAKAALTLLQSLPRPEEQHISKLAIQQAAVAQERTQSLLDGLQTLAARDEVSKQQLFDATKAVEQARLQREAAERQYELSMLGPRSEAIDEAQSRISIALQAIDTAQARLDLHTLRAPIEGVLQDLTCQLGQTIAAGATVAEIVDTDRLNVLAWLPPRSARLVRVGQSVEVAIGESAPVAESSSSEHDAEVEEPEALQGKIEFVGQVADPQTGNLPVRCLVDNHDGRLAVGQTVGLSIAVRQNVDVLSVPVAAVFDVGEGPVLNVVRDGKTEHLHPHLGPTHDGWVAVSDADLQPGELVVIEGGYNLKEETPVKIEGDESAHDDPDTQ